MSSSGLARMFTARWLKTPSPALAGASSRADRTIHWAMLRPFLPSVTVCAFVFVFVVTLWRFGYLQFFELQVYDSFLRSHAPASDAGSQSVIVGVTEEDLKLLQKIHVPDDALSDALEHLIQAQPAAIVVDLYRDLPVPGNDPNGRDRL